MAQNYYVFGKILKYLKNEKIKSMAHKIIICLVKY